MHHQYRSKGTKLNKETKFTVRIEDGKTIFQKTITKDRQFTKEEIEALVKAETLEQAVAGYGDKPAKEKITRLLSPKELPKGMQEQLINAITIARKYALSAELGYDADSQDLFSSGITSIPMSRAGNG